MPKSDYPSPYEIAFATMQGTKVKNPDGSVSITARHPNDKDYRIEVTTRNNKVMSAKSSFMPLSQVQDEDRQKRGEEKARQDLSKSRQKARLEKKRARTPAPKNKKPKNKN